MIIELVRKELTYKNEHAKQSRFALLRFLLKLIMIGLLGALIWFIFSSLDRKINSYSEDASYHFLVLFLFVVMVISIISATVRARVAIFSKKDARITLTLPIPIETLIIAKVIYIYLKEVMINFVLSFPLLLAYGLNREMHPEYYVFSVFYPAIISIFSVSFALLVVVVVQNFYKIISKSTVTQFVLAALIVIGLCFAYQFVLEMFLNALNDSQIGGMFSSEFVEGLKYVTGEYLTFCDNDDFFDEDYIETLYKNCENGKYDVVVSGYRRPNENGDIIKEVHLQDYEWSKYMIITPWAKIFRKSYIIDNKIDYLSNDIGEDIYFNIQAMTLTKKIKIIDYVGYNWFYNTKSVSNTKHKDIRKIDIYKFLNNTYDVVKEKKILENNYEIIEMVFIKTVMWILTYSCKKLPYKVIKEEFEKLFNWLEEGFPKYKKTKLIGFNKPEGEDKGNQRIYRVFMRLHKMHLGKLLIYFYSKI